MYIPAKLSAMVGNIPLPYYCPSQNTLAGCPAGAGYKREITDNRWLTPFNKIDVDVVWPKNITFAIIFVHLTDKIAYA